MAARPTHTQAPDQPETAPVPATRGEPSTTIIVAVLVAIVLLVIVLWAIFGR